MCNFIGRKRSNDKRINWQRLKDPWKIYKYVWRASFDLVATVEEEIELLLKRKSSGKRVFNMRNCIRNDNRSFRFHSILSLSSKLKFTEWLEIIVSHCEEGN